MRRSLYFVGRMAVLSSSRSSYAESVDKPGDFVLAAKLKFELLAHQLLEDDDHRTNASVAIQDGQILLRNDQYLGCIGQRRAAAGLSAR